MELLGLPLSTLLTTFALVGTAVTALYLLKQRRKRAQVAYLPLWESLLGDQHSSALFSRLKRIASLLLTLLIAALLVLSLGNPQRRSARVGKTVVLLVDAGETMQVRREGRSRLDRALELAEAAVSALGPDDQALVAQLDEAVTPLSPLTDDGTRLRDALREIRATHLESDLAEGVRFARDVTRGHANAELVVVSDGLLRSEETATALLAEANAPTLRYLRVDEGPVDNAGLSAFAARRYPLDRTQVEVLVRAHNQSGRALPAELVLQADGREVHRQALLLPAGGEVPLVLTDLPGADRSLTARLEMPGFEDAFPVDDEAVARVPERKRLRVRLVSEGNRYLEAALLLDEYLRVDLVAPGEDGDAEGFDAVIFDGVLPNAAPSTPALYLLPQSPGAPGQSPLELRDGSEERPFVGRIDRDHPLTRFAALQDVNIRTARHVRLSAGDRAVVRSERGSPLVVAGRRRGHPFVALTFDPRDSDLPMRVAWPLLVLNALDVLSGQSPHYTDSHRVGEVVAVEVQDGTSTVTLRAPDGRTRNLEPTRGRVQFVPSLAGLHTLQTSGGTLEEVAVQRPRTGALELEPRQRLAEVPTTRPRAAMTRNQRRLWPWLLLLALGLASLEWLTFHRRVTV